MKKDTSKSTIFVISMVFLILYLVFSWEWAVVTSLVIGVIGVVSNTLCKVIEKGWMGLPHFKFYYPFYSVRHCLLLVFIPDFSYFKTLH